MNVDKRLYWLDASKGFGMLLVIAGHVGLLNGCVAISCFMSLFYFVSGLTFKKCGIKEMMQKKVKRLIYPMAFYYLLLTSMWIVYSRGMHYTDITGFFYAKYEHGLNPFDNTLWFFPSLFLSVNLVNFIYNVNKCTALLISVAFLFLSYYCSTKDILLPWSIESLGVTSIILYIGSKSKRFFNAVDKHTVSVSIVLLPIFFIIAKYNDYTNLSISIYGAYKLSLLIYVVIGVLFGFIVTKCFQILEKISHHIVNFFALLGRYSIELMCLHLPWLIVLQECNPLLRMLLSIIIIVIAKRIYDMYLYRIFKSIKLRFE